MPAPALAALQYLPLVAETSADLGRWFLQNRSELGDVFDRVRDTVYSAVSDGPTKLDRIGAAIVSSTETGNREVIGLIHRQGDAIGGVQAAVEGVAVGQAAMASALNGLTALSAVGLGVTVLSHVVLAAQLHALKRRMDSLKAEIKVVQEMLKAVQLAELYSGLNLLNKGEKAPENGQRELYVNSVTTLTKSSAYYEEQLAASVETKGADRSATRTLARLVILPALGQATALAHLRHDTDEIVKPIDQAAAILRRYAAGQFATIVDADPTRFLIPAMAQNGVTLDSMAELYRQAGHVGAVPAGRQNSAADLFERVRDKAYTIKDPMFRKQSIVTQATADLCDVTGVLEEVNRVQGLALAIRTYNRSERSFADLASMLAKELDARRGTEVEEATYAVFPR